MSKMLKGVVVRPQEKPDIILFEDSLTNLQEIVDGYIEFVYPFKDNAVLMCNEEGKLIPLQGNRTVNGDVIAGTFLIIGSGDEGDLISLTDEQIEKYINMFSNIEDISDDEVEDSIHIEVIAYD